MTFDGMNIDKMFDIGRSLKLQVVAVDTIRGSVDRLIGSARQNWSGRDLTAFADAWTRQHRPLMTQLRENLEFLANLALKNADEQQQASGSDHDPGRDFPTPGLSQQIQEDWRSMPDAERRLVLQYYADEQADRYGLAHVVITFRDLVDDSNPSDDLRTNAYGSWEESSKMLTLDSTDIDDPKALSTIAHEMRHAAQHQAITYLGEDRTSWGGVERGEVQKWKDNLADGGYISPETDFKAYQGQPVEEDARQAELNAMKGLSPEHLNELRRRAGVMVTPQVGPEISLA